jgi:arginyl-tRNA synthetase
MNIFKIIHNEISAILEAMISSGELPADTSISAVTAEPPRDASHGDVSTNAAMVIAKTAKKNPAELAKIIAEKIKSIEVVESVSVAGAGFINMTLKPYIWQDVLLGIMQEGVGYGNSDLGKGEKVNIE